MKRAEEYRVDIPTTGEVIRLQHILPESAPGGSLTEGQARTLAHETLKTLFRLDPDVLKEISAVASKLPARQDWTFTFSDPKNYPVKEGQARIVILLTGDQLADAYRYIFVPEEWGRRETSRANIADLILICCWGFLVLGLLVAVIMSIVRWSRRQFSVPTFLFFFAVSVIVQILSYLNHWPVALSNLSTAEPVTHQLFKIIAGGLVSILLQSSFIALVLGYIQTAIPLKAAIQPGNLWIRGVSVALIFSGLFALLNHFVAPSLAPRFADYGHWSTYVPLVDSALGAVPGLINVAAMILLYFVFADRMTASWSRKKLLAFFFFLLLGLSLAGLEGIESIRYWVLSGLFTGFLLWGIYFLVVRFGLLCLVFSAGTVVILGAIKQAVYRPFPHAVLAGLIQIGAVCVLSYWSFKKLGRQVASRDVSD